MVPSQVGGGMAGSSATSGIFFQEDQQSHDVGNSHLSYSLENSSSTIPENLRPDVGPNSGDASILNNVATSGPSVGASSLVTDANSGLSGGPRLQRSASINTDSCMRLPASPMSFSSNNISISGSSVMDGSSVVQQSSNRDPSSYQNQLYQSASSATSFPAARGGQVSLPSGPIFHRSFIQDPTNIYHIQKKSRMDIKQEDIQQQQAMQHMLQRQDYMQLQTHNPQLQALVQQQRLRKQQLLQSMPQVQRAHLLWQQQQQQQQIRQQVPHGVQPSVSVQLSYNGEGCSRRLMQYLHHQRQRPTDNNTFAYWRKFVAEYYSPRAKKRLCFSLYDSVQHHSLGVFPQSAWECDICGSKSGRGFEVTFEVLPRLNESKFCSGVIDELLYLELPRETRFPCGIMMLTYEKAVQESVYEQLRVVREGQLRVIFTADLKILSWEFCARRHEVLVPRRFVAPHVNQLLQVVRKCQNTIAESGPDGVSQQDLLNNSNMVVTAGHQLAKVLELQSLNDLGFSQRYMRCLQISEVVNSIKDLMDICGDQKDGPIEGLKKFSRLTNPVKAELQKRQDLEQLVGMQALPTDHGTQNKLVAEHAGLNNQINSNIHIAGRAALNGSPRAAMALSNNQNMMMRQNSFNSNSNSLQQMATSFNNSNQKESLSFQGPACVSSRALQNLPVNGFLGSHLIQPQQRSLNLRGIMQRNHQQSPQGSQALPQHMIQRRLQDIIGNSNSRGLSQQQQLLSGYRGDVHGGLMYGSSTFSGTATQVNRAANASEPMQTRSNSFKGVSSTDASAAGGNNGSSHCSDLPQNLHFSDELGEDNAHEFSVNGFFSDLDETMGYGDWKA